MKIGGGPSAAMAPSFSMSPSSKTSALVLALTIALSAHSVAAFYLPGVAPTDYELGEAMRVKRNAFVTQV
ncbi:hypothetical protein T484DRAFT_1804135 [Baffinella frigidus]|nr:hypothetical protein T484DRAFT_1804135 [Cryptophyta sp. CCMP2293]